VNYRRVFVLAAALVIALLVTRAPASLLGNALPPAVNVTGLAGTVWKGEAAYVEIPLQAKPFALGRISWTLNPMGLFFGDVIRLRSDWGSQTVDVSISPALNGSFDVNDAQLRIDLGWLRQLLPFYVGGQLKADLAVVDIYF
jgi:hypothetical protein